MNAVGGRQSVKPLRDRIFQFHLAGDGFFDRKLSGSHHAYYPWPGGVLISQLPR